MYILLLAIVFVLYPVMMVGNDHTYSLHDVTALILQISLL